MEGFLERYYGMMQPTSHMRWQKLFSLCEAFEAKLPLLICNIIETFSIVALFRRGWKIYFI